MPIENAHPDFLPALPAIADRTGYAFGLGFHAYDAFSEAVDILVRAGVNFRLHRADRHGQPAITMGDNGQTLALTMAESFGDVTVYGEDGKVVASFPARAA